MKSPGAKDYRRMFLVPSGLTFGDCVWSRSWGTLWHPLWDTFPSRMCVGSSNKLYAHLNHRKRYLKQQIPFPWTLTLMSARVGMKSIEIKGPWCLCYRSVFRMETYQVTCAWPSPVALCTRFLCSWSFTHVEISFQGNWRMEMVFVFHATKTMYCGPEISWLPYDKGQFRRATIFAQMTLINMQSSMIISWMILDCGQDISNLTGPLKLWCLHMPW